MKVKTMRDHLFTALDKYSWTDTDWEYGRVSRKNDSYDDMQFIKLVRICNNHSDWRENLHDRFNMVGAPKEWDSSLKEKAQPFHNEYHKGLNMGRHFLRLKQYPFVQMDWECLAGLQSAVGRRKSDSQDWLTLAKIRNRYTELFLQLREICPKTCWFIDQHRVKYDYDMTSPDKLPQKTEFFRKLIAVQRHEMKHLKENPEDLYDYVWQALQAVYDGLKSRAVYHKKINPKDKDKKLRPDLEGHGYFGWEAIPAKEVVDEE